EAVWRKLLGEADEVAGRSIDEDVETAEGVHRPGNHRLDGGRIANVAGERDCAHAVRLDLARGRGEMFEPPARNRDVAAVGCQRERDATANPRAAAGHQSSTTLEQ